MQGKWKMQKGDAGRFLQPSFPAGCAVFLLHSVHFLCSPGLVPYSSLKHLLK